MVDPHDEEMTLPESGDPPGVTGPVLKLRADAVDWRVVESQVVALDRARSVYLAVNPSGAALWSAIVEGATRDELVNVLLETFDVESAQAAADVDAFVADLNERQLLEW